MSTTMTTTTEEAMAVLEANYPSQLTLARAIAHEQIDKNGTTHTRAVRAEMKRRGLLDTTKKEHWMGALFRTAEFIQTGDTVDCPIEPGEGGRQHCSEGKPVKVWTRKNAR